MRNKTYWLFLAALALGIQLSSALPVPATSLAVTPTLLGPTPKQSVNRQIQSDAAKPVLTPVFKASSKLDDDAATRTEESGAVIHKRLLETAFKVASKTASVINKVLPWGGKKGSGRGRRHGRNGQEVTTNRISAPGRSHSSSSSSSSLSTASVNKPGPSTLSMASKAASFFKGMFRGRGKKQRLSSSSSSSSGGSSSHRHRPGRHGDPEYPSSPDQSWHSPTRHTISPARPSAPNRSGSGSSQGSVNKPRSFDGDSIAGESVADAVHKRLVKMNMASKAVSFVKKVLRCGRKQACSPSSSSSSSSWGPPTPRLPGQRSRPGFESDGSSGRTYHSPSRQTVTGNRNSAPSRSDSSSSEASVNS